MLFSEVLNRIDPSSNLPERRTPAFRSEHDKQSAPV